MNQNNKYKIFLKRVYDGDTLCSDIHLGFGIVLVDQKIRLARIQAPELYDLVGALGANWDSDSMEEEAIESLASRVPNQAGLDSRDHLDKALNKGGEIYIGDVRKEKYGRWLAEVYLANGSDHTNMSDMMLSDGKAKVYGTI